MEKRNTLLLTIIAIATLLVAVVGATFAYFASTTDTNSGKVNLNVETANKTATFTAVGGGDMNINVTADLMQESNAGDGGAQQTANGTLDANLTANSNINVSLNSPTEGQLVTCSYDLVFEWANDSKSNYKNGEGSDGNSYKNLNTDSQNGVQIGDDGDKKYYPSTYYVRTGYKASGTDHDNIQGFKELTIDVASTTYTGDDDGRGSSGSSLEEINIDELKLGSDNKTLTLLKGEEISTDKETGAHIDYEITVRFYNLDKDQSHLMGKTFKGTVSVANYHC